MKSAQNYFEGTIRQYCVLMLVVGIGWTDLVYPKIGHLDRKNQIVQLVLLVRVLLQEVLESTGCRPTSIVHHR